MIISLFNLFEDLSMNELNFRLKGKVLISRRQERITVYSEWPSLTLTQITVYSSWVAVLFGFGLSLICII